MKHYTYITINLLNNKKYVGDHSTDNLNDGYLGSGSLLKRDINKFGRENFEKKILEFFKTKEEAFLAQRKYIKKFKTHETQGGYNKNWSGGQWATIVSDPTRKKISEKISGSNNGMYGKKHSDEAKKKIKNKRAQQKNVKGPKHTEESKILCGIKNIGNSYRKGFKTSEETKEKLKLINYGKKHSDETKEKISESSKGRIVSRETKKKISKSNKGRKFSEEHKNKLRKAKLGKKRGSYNMNK